MTIKTSLFDLGNVLLFFSPKRMLDQLSEISGVEPKRFFEAIYRQGLLYAYETGRLTTEELYRTLRKHAPRAFTYLDFLNAYSNIFTPNTELWPIVERLKTRGQRLILVSNISECHFNRAWHEAPILKLFDELILSYRVGSVKPEPHIFKKALSAAGCLPEECFYTDDIADYIFTARRQGIRAVQYTTTSKLEQALARHQLS